MATLKVNKLFDQQEDPLCSILFKGGDSIECVVDLANQQAWIQNNILGKNTASQKVSIAKHEELKTIVDLPNDLNLPPLNLIISFKSLCHKSLRLPTPNKGWHIHVAFQGSTNQKWRDGWTYESLDERFLAIIPPGSEIKWQNPLYLKTPLSKEILDSFNPIDDAMESLKNSIGMQLRAVDALQVNLTKLNPKEALALYFIRLAKMNLKITACTPNPKPNIPRYWKSFLSSLNISIQPESTGCFQLESLVFWESLDPLMIEAITKEVNKRSRIFDLREL